MAAHEVIGHAAADAVEFNALPDQPGTGQGAVHVEGQHFGREHLQLQRHGQPILDPARADADEDLARQKHLARRPALQAIEIRQPFGIGIIGPGEPQRLQLFLPGRIHDGGRRLDSIADDIAGEAFHRIGGIAVVPDKPAGAGGDGVAGGRNQCVHMRAAGPEPAQATIGLRGIEPTDDRSQR